MKKALNIDGEIVNMTFEEAYIKFKKLRFSQARKWSGLCLEREDLMQEIDMAFFQSYEKYDEKFNSTTKFSTFVLYNIHSRMWHIHRDMNNLKRKTYWKTSSFNEGFNYYEESMEYGDTFGEASFEDGSNTMMDFNATMQTLTPKDRQVIALLIKGYSQSEVAKFVGCAQVTVSRIKTRFLDLVKKVEIAS